MKRATMRRMVLAAALGLMAGFGGRADAGLIVTGPSSIDVAPNSTFTLTFTLGNDGPNELDPVANPPGSRLVGDPTFGLKTFDDLPNSYPALPNLAPGSSVGYTVTLRTEGLEAGDNPHIDSFTLNPAYFDVVTNETFDELSNPVEIRISSVPEPSTILSAATAALLGLAYARGRARR